MKTPPTPISARGLALDLLDAVLRQRRPLDEAITAHRRWPELASRDRAFARSCGLQHNLEEPQDFMGAGAFSVIVAAPDLRVLKIVRNLADRTDAADITSFLSSTLSVEPLTLPRGAPVPTKTASKPPSSSNACMLSIR